MRVGEKIWWCERVYEENEETPTYKPPVAILLRPSTAFSPISITCQPKNGFTDYNPYGETTNSDQRIILRPYQYWVNKFKVGDLFYLDGTSPAINEEYHGQGANYYVELVSNQNEAIVLSVKQIQNER